jgi:hypothetical protein
MTTDRISGPISDLGIKAPVRVESSGNLTLSGLQTVSAVVLAAGDRVLVKDQTAGADNGIYVVATGSWTRALDWDGSYDIVSGTMVPTQAGALYRVTTADPIVVGTTTVAFEVAGGTQDRVINSQASNYTFTLADRGKVVYMPFAGTGTYTIPANSSVAFPIGSVLRAYNAAPNAVTIAITTDSLQLEGSALVGSRQLAQNRLATFTKQTATTWIVEMTEVAGFTGTLTGVSSGGTGNVLYSITAGIVTLYVAAALVGVSNTTSMTMTGMPADIRPYSVPRILPCLVVNSSGQYMGSVSIATSGVITFSMVVIAATLATLSTTGFTASGNKGVDAGWTLTYSLR